MSFSPSDRFVSRRGDGVNSCGSPGVAEDETKISQLLTGPEPKPLIQFCSLTTGFVLCLILGLLCFLCMTTISTFTCLLGFALLACNFCLFIFRFFPFFSLSLIVAATRVLENWWQQLNTEFSLKRFQDLLLCNISSLPLWFVAW